MSMTAEEVLFNCKKQFDFIKTDIDTLLRYVKELLEQCRDIDNSSFFVEQFKEIEKVIKNEIEDLKISEEYVKEVETETHIAIERYHEIQRFAEQKRDKIAEIKARVLGLRKDVVKKEQETIAKNLYSSVYESFEQLKNILINSQKNIDDKTIMLNYLNDNEAVLKNFSKENIINKANSYISAQKESIKYLSKQVVNDIERNYSYDNDLIEAIEKEKIEYLNNLNEDNFIKNSKIFFSKVSKNIENESIRKDNVIKIINAIQATGYLVDENDIKKIKEKNLVLIHAVKETGESADFAVRLDGSFLYNYEGFEGHEHDADADAFLKKMREQGITSWEAFNKQYREPKYVSKNSAIINSKKKSSGK
ncbi:hypothetical protein [Spiroplasma tabanidicola]|uniref:Uncharacterized protein n=1 Tax=Spiroplasma tabanidicola TaxID=324079 RepID=A0A6I6CHS5_9MOLU|nr:hypothetical protein [Spiroplasma tabanidicola]QGS51603.1 hypothetical protein STABA_v1c02360 [Spiroplasma tabanidicola]